MIKKISVIAALGFIMGAVYQPAQAEAPGIIPGINRYESERARMKQPQSMVYMPDGENYLLLSADRKQIVKYETATGKEVGTVLDVERTRNASIPAIQGYSVSPDGTKLLVFAESKPIYRYSYYAKYYVYEIMHNILTPLSTEQEWQRCPIFSPDGRMVAFVSENNIYLKKLDFGTITAVTSIGKKNEIINGVPDWGYEEEFDITCAMEWAPDNTTLVYLRFNETEVPVYTFPLYEGYCPADERYAYYPGIFEYKYSLPGEKNSTVSLHSFDVDTRKTKDIVFPGNPDYIPRFYFSPNDASCLLVATLNRDQTRMELYTVNPKSTVVKSLLVEEPGAWVLPDTYEKLTTLDKSFVLMSPRSGYTHLYEYSYQGSLMRTITSGNYDVMDYYGADSQGNHYFLSDNSGAVNRVVSRVDIKNKVTDISPVAGVSSATFSPGCNFFVLRHSTATQPPVYNLYNNKLKNLRELASNNDLPSKYPMLPTKEFIKVPSAASGIELNAYIIKPLNFDPSRRYPVIMWQYSGPGSSTVLDSWSVDWQMFAAANEGYIVACVDPRGTAGRGYEFLTTSYRHLGIYETEDQCAAARYLATLPYVDGAHIGIAGWSYGGYETLMALSAVNSPFAAGVAVAPVTSWRYYDSIYTERYMLTPAQNPDGYVSSSPVNISSRLNVPLLLMSGTADDNVHFTNTVQYLSSILSQGKLCNLMIFPNKNHSISGCSSRDLVYSNMLNHFNLYLK